MARRPGILTTVRHSEQMIITEVRSHWSWTAPWADIEASILVAAKQALEEARDRWIHDIDEREKRY